jgi:phenylalanyl-tRNA synthetase alpha chain
MATDPTDSAAQVDPEQVAETFDRAVAGVGTEHGLREIRAAYLGPKGRVQQVLRRLGGLPPAERKSWGERANRAKERIEAIFERALAEVHAAARRRDLERTVDITLPGRAPARGALHPLTATRREIEAIFAELGYTVAEGPQVESDVHNFEALNMPKDHPARDMQDTFYLGDDVVLRTHTSPVQIRTMVAQDPPIRIIAPGLVYRRDDDPTHSPMFTQFECLLVDRTSAERPSVRFSDLKGTLLYFVRRFFDDNVSIRLRPSFFPFTEPSAEVDVQCTLCRGAGCRTCKGTGWLEIGGAGLVHPNVFRKVAELRAAHRLDPAPYETPGAVAGFAFGMGIERMAMLRHGISDIKLFYESDVRFLQQFS